MKKLLFILLLCATTAQAQLRFGIKAGANFADLDGITLDTKMRTGFHFGALLELDLPGPLAIQPELVYSSQGAKVNAAAFDDIQYDYLTVPVALKLYLIPSVLNVELGPQFSFLVNDNNAFNPGDSSSFDFAALGGLGLDLGNHLFLQGRYVLGLTDASSNADVKNKVIQLSVGYKF
ncbi:porin family protein [Flavobacterium caeni]|uniref:Outer membrane protein beta-barrel domain-containing protein n=1 Tax=Flavobacterium caeni TaxID=490189 RepID=A0A1G5HMS3_9FLAO|nr:porin family protein [Flavobacterium caeni]SCY64600.1 Outer membrane protein beta-barrel domain-containing protein [Flavobacterium caeni]